jgi:hypothetical protein
MKRLIQIAAVLVAALTTSSAQTATNSVVASPPPVTITTKQALRVAPPRAPAYNRIVRGNRVYRGVGVQLIKADNPLQLINPFAPAEYGNGFDNMVLTPGGTRSQGLALLSIDF